MAGSPIRVAFFTDCFHEVNGVALTSRQFTAYARQNELPFLAVHGGETTKLTLEPGSEELQLATSAARLGVERDLAFDLAFWRHLDRVQETLRCFRPDLVHVTSPGHIGLLGAIAAHRLRLPLTASWHTNIHEFGARRLGKLLSFVPMNTREIAVSTSEAGILTLVLRFYRLAKLQYAPNPELVEMLERRTGRRCLLMERGIDVDLFSPKRRRRTDGEVHIGFVGRLSPEKNVRALADVDRILRASGLSGYRFVVVGDGSEREWLKANLPGAVLPGVLRGVELAQAYADMDVFLFPSETDTYGNVIQEAMASGVPCIASRKGGPKFLVNQGVTGYLGSSPEEYASALTGLIRDRGQLGTMRAEARAAAEGKRWSAVFDRVYSGYRSYLFPESNLQQTIPSSTVSHNIY